jgi:acetyltransferase-like isoleucine patch superfamily enzyme
MSGRLSSLVGVLRERAGHDRMRRRLEATADGVRIHPSVDVRGPERLTLGPGVFVDHGAVLHCGGQAWSAGEGSIVIGANTYIGPKAVLFGAGRIEIGDAVLISPGVVITSQQHGIDARDVDIRDQPLRFAPVVIERNVWIGANATILPGVRVGHGSVVGAGAVVARDVPPLSVVLGVPARVTRER